MKPLAKQLPGGVLRLTDSPIRFMQARAASGPPRLRSALLPVVLNALFVGGVGMVIQYRMTMLMPGIPDTGAASGMPSLLAILAVVIFGLFGFAAHAVAVVMFDMLTAQSDAPKRWRLVELSALAYWPQLLWSVPALAAVWWLYDPPPLVFRGAGADMTQAALRYGEQLAAEPFQIVMARTQQMAGIWLIALHAVALRVVSGLTVGGTWAAGIVLLVLFIGAPMAVGVAVEWMFF